MRKESSLPVRLDTDMKERLLQIGDDLGLTVSAMVRLLVRSFVQEFDRNGGKVVFPLEWKSSSGASSKAAADKPAKTVKSASKTKTRKD
jgi:antitoxin component of RelBE/YafQ-DinJ toxin-antitoxin module